MTLQFNIGEAKDRLSQLLAAAKRGEDVVIARAGTPEARLVAISTNEAKLDLAARRRAFVGSVMPSAELAACDWFEPMSDEELALWYDGPLLNDDDAPAS